MSRSLLAMAAIFALALTACHHGPSRMDRAMDSWVGKPIGDVIMRFGAPSASMKLPDGRTVYTWKNMWSGGQYGQYIHECRITFTTGTDDRVANWSYRDC